MPEPDPAPAHDDAGKTIIQPGDAQTSSRELSKPDDAKQDAGAPKIAGYLLSHPLGKGAFAEVWKAWQERTRKWVALKVFTQRTGVNWIFLQREMERLVRLDRHPNVVTLLDADLSGEPAYYAMDLLEKGSLAQFPDNAKSAPTADVARWMEEAAGALSYVHGKGLIHCDVKPANLLLDEQNRLRVADFGQSRIVTESSGALGTLHYMAPEQAMTQQESADLHPDVRWDVYALGATVHALLSGKVPYGGRQAELEAAPSLAERLAAYRRVVQSEALPNLEQTTYHAVDEDLAAIVAKCVAADPARRYASMAELLADLRARSEKRPVSPLAHVRSYRAKRFIQRNGVATALSLVLVAVLVGAAGGLRRRNAELTRAGVSLKQELADSYILRGRQSSERGDSPSAAVLFAKANALSESASARRDALVELRTLIAPTRIFYEGGVVNAAALSPDGRKLLLGGRNGVKLLDAETGNIIKSLSDRSPSGNDDATRGLEFNADGTRAYALPSTGGVILLDGNDGKIIADFHGSRAVFSPDGSLIATTSLLRDREGSDEGAFVARDPDAAPVAGKPRDIRDVVVWDARTGKEKSAFRLEVEKKFGIPWLEFSPDGKTLLTCIASTMEFWNPLSGKRSQPAIKFDGENRFLVFPLERAHFSPDGKQILNVTWNRAEVFDRATGRPLGKVMRHEGHLVEAYYVGHRGLIVTSSEDGALREWTGGPGANSGVPVEFVLRQPAPLGIFAVSADGRVAATVSGDSARLWSVEEWSSFDVTLLHSGPIESASFSRDAKRLVTAGRDGAVRVWDIPSAPVGRRKVPMSEFEPIISPDGKHAVAVDSISGPMLRELPSGATVQGALAGALSAGKNSTMHTFAFSQDGSRLLSVANQADEVRVWDAKSGAAVGNPFRFGVTTEPRPKQYFSPTVIAAAALNSDGKVLFTADMEKMGLWDVLSGRLTGQGKVGGYVSGAAFSPDGTRLALSVNDKTQIWAVPLSSAPLRDIPHGGGRVVWSPDGTRLATTRLEFGTVRLWRIADGAQLGPGYSHANQIMAVEFSRDGSRLLTASRDGTVRLTNVTTGDSAAAPIQHGKEVWSAAFSPDGAVLASGGDDGIIRLWDARTGEPVGRPLKQGRLINAVEFSPDSKTLVAVGNWSIHFWDTSWIGESADPKALQSRAEGAALRRVNDQGQVVSYSAPPKAAGK